MSSSVVLRDAGNQIRVGMALDIDGRIYRVTKNQPVKPGKGGAYAQVRNERACWVESYAGATERAATIMP